MSRKRDIVDMCKRLLNMPVLARFYGVTIRMCFQQAEHNPPHIHAIYGEDIVAICIKSKEILEGYLPPLE